MSNMDNEDVVERAFALFLVVMLVALALTALAGVAWIWMAVLA